MKCRRCGIPWKYCWEYCLECRLNYGGAKYPATQTDKELSDIEALIGQINRAFNSVTLGGGQSIHQAHFEGIHGPGDPVSRQTIEAGERVLREVAERDLTSLDLLAVWIDGLQLGSYHVICAVGVDPPSAI